MRTRASAVPARPGEPPAAELRALLDALPASVALWDTEVCLRYGNRRSLERFGRPARELQGAHLADVVQAHSVDLSARYIDGALAGRPQQVERAMVDADGQRFNAHQVTHIPNVLGGVVRGYCALAVDITASIEGYEQARRAREQAALRAVRERIVGDIDRQHVVDDLGEALERLDVALGRAADVLPSLAPVVDAIDHGIEELRSLVPARLQETAGPEGLPISFPAMSAPFDVVSLGPGAGVPWPTDVTGRDWSAEEFTTLLDMLPVGIAVWDAELRNVFANRAALRWFDRGDRAAVRGGHARDLFGPEVFEAANIAYAEAALRGAPQQFDRSVTHASGLRHLQVYCAPRMRDGRIDGIYSLVVDVTARVDAELELQQARAELASARERERIADQLHNLVIQRLFAAGLAAAAATPAMRPEQLLSVQDGILGALEDLDAAMTSLHEGVGLLDLLPDLAHLVNGAARPHGVGVAIENVGSVEYISPVVGVEVLAVAEEALSNIVDHAGATRVVVTIAADEAEVWLRIADDGRGIGEAPAGKGMADMAARALRLGGTCTWRPNEPSGTLVDWRVPAP